MNKVSLQNIFFYPLYVLLWLFTILPSGVQYFIADIIFVILYYVIGYRKRVVYKNLNNAFPEKQSAGIKRIAKKFYHHLADYFIESIMLLNISKEEINKRFQHSNPELLEKYYKKGKSILLISGHYGNWEWTANLPFFTSHHVMAIYKPLRNEFFDKLFIRLRSRFGLEPVPINSLPRKLALYKRDNIPTCTYFLGDQRPMGRHSRYWTPFLNQEAPVFQGIEKIGRKTNQPIIFYEARKIKRGYYITKFTELVDEPAKTIPNEITEKHLRALEKLIREEPAYWLWSHDRWKWKRRLIEAWQESVRNFNTEITN